MITRQRAEEAAGAHGAARPCRPAGPGGERLLGGQAPVHDYTSTPLDPLPMSIGFIHKRLFLIETLLQLIYNLETRFQGNKHP